MQFTCSHFYIDMLWYVSHTYFAVWQSVLQLTGLSNPRNFRKDKNNRENRVAVCS